MIVFPFCPDKAWPDKLVGVFHALNEFGRCFWEDIVLTWNGSAWVLDNWGPLSVTVGLEYDAETERTVAKAAWSLNGGENCSESGQSSYGCSCDPSLFTTSCGGELSGTCCGWEPWKKAVVETYFHFGPPITMGKPPKIAPPCSNVPDDQKECCLKAIAGGGGGGGRGGCGGPGRPPVRAAGAAGIAPYSSGYSCAPVQYATGELLLTATDIESNGFGVPWGHTRRFASRLSLSESLGNGYNWQVEQWPYLVIDYDGNAVVLGKGSTALWFTRVGDAYVGEFNVKQTFVEDIAADVFRLHEADGGYTEFDRATRMFRRYVDPAGNRVEVKALCGNQYNFTQVERVVTTNGSTTTEQYLYEYDGSLGDQLLQSVTLRRKIDNGPWTNVARATYSYYGFEDDHGSAGDLRSVTTQAWVDNQWQDTGTTLYRYYKEVVSSSSSSSSGGEGTVAAHLLKYVVNPAAFARLAADPEVSDPLTAPDWKVAEYADYYFEYDSFRRVTKEAVQGGSREFTFQREQSANADGYNSWKYKTTETQPGGVQNIVYSNYAGQPMLRVYQSGTDQWFEFTKYNELGQPVLHANPSAVTGYDEQYADLLHEVGGSYEYLKDDEGLIHLYEYDGPTGWIACEKIQKGQFGTPIKLREYEYLAHHLEASSSSSSSSSSGTSEPLAYFLSREIVYPSDTDQERQIVTAYSYTWYPGTHRVLQKTTTLPAVSVDQNGSGESAVRREVFDVYGDPIWLMDERSFLTRNTFDPVTGALVQQIQDVDTSRVSDVPAGWQTPASGGLHLVTDFEHDDRGRLTQQLGPEHTVDLEGTATTVRRATWMVYMEGTTTDEVWSAQGYATGLAPNYAYTLVNPVLITKLDKHGNVLEQIQATRASTSGRLLATDTFPQSSYVRWTTNQYAECCSLVSTRVYHTIPESGEGQADTHYDQTEFGYNDRGVRNRTVTAGGTITDTVFDARDLAVKVFIGTNDTGATDDDPTGGGAEGNNMILVTEYQYDGGQDGGDGTLTRQTQHVDSTTTRVTDFTYDWRNRRTDTDGEVDFYEKVYYDNLDRPVKVERFNTTANGNLIARGETLYDDRGRVYRTKTYAVDPATGSVGNALTSDAWFDAAGKPIKRLPAGSKLFTKTVYDGLGRPIREYKGYDLDETAYSEAWSVSDDTIVEQTERTYDAAGNVVKQETRQRYHNATGTGALNGPSSDQPKSRIIYVAAWHDPIGRAVATADCGTNSGTSLSRPDTIPARSDSVLVNSLGYDSAGNVSTSTNPAGIVTKFEYDAAGRQVSQVINYVPASSSSSSTSGEGCPASDDTNVTVLTAYNADGNVSQITVVNGITGDQVTQYVYGTTLADSGIATSILKRAEVYPDSADADDRIEFKHNRQREVTEIKDQNGTVHAFDYDKLGRQTQDRVTTLGSGVDGAIRRIATTYEVRGMREKITSCDNPNVGSGSVDNEVLFVYNPFGQLVTEYHEHGGAVNTSTSPKVQYGYADGSTNTVRPTSLTYPDGRVLTYSYGSGGTVGDALSRVASLVDNDAGSTHLADYSYLGLNTFVEVDYTEPDIKYTLVGTAGGNDPDTGDIYRGFDRFGRIKDSYWYNYGSATDVDRILYGYDRAGNRTYREQAVDPNSNFDEVYRYDLIDRLKDMERGPLNQSKDAVMSLKFAQCWGLDATGNWSRFSQDDDGNGWDLVQSRAHNGVNEITDITETVGAMWITPQYDRAGNMIRVPKPTDSTQMYACTYDAWNRLVRVQEGANTVAEYRYDGTKRRTVKKTYTGGVLSETRHFYYTEPSKWQVIEERVGASANADRQFVWGLRYVDDLVLRERDTDANSILDERLYGLQDANWNATAVVNNAGNVEERYTYDAYGQLSCLTPSFSTRSSSVYDWETGFAAYRWDNDTLLYCVRHRYYWRSAGWLQRDPIRYKGGINLYAYCGNNPTMYVDLSGEVAFVVIQDALLVLALAILVCAYPYIEQAYTNYPGAGDSFLHCLVSCQMAKECGGVIAEWAGLAKEAQDIVAGILDKIETGKDIDWEDSLDDWIANQQCIPWESWIPPANWIGALIRRSCDCCCRERVGYYTKN